MSSERDSKKIFDEVHGYINLDPLALKIISLPIFQRLRRIKQLGVAEYVYPGATHTRFSHSLGVYHLMKSIVNMFRDYIEPDKIPLLHVAALLHDIGHLPYSHALETFYMNIQLASGERLDHERLSSMVIREDPELKDLLKSEGLDPDEIARIVEGKHRDPLINMLLSSDLDVDRLDYLVRDSLHTGVTYGSIDLRRILTTLRIDRNRRLAISEKGLIALENFYLARLHMYRAVYYHKTVHGYELMLVKLWERIVRERPDMSSYRDLGFVRKMISEGYYKYFDDHTLISEIIDVARDLEVSRETRELAEMFLFRKGYKVVYDKIILSDEPLSDSEEGEEEITKIKEAYYSLSRSGVSSIYYLPVIESIAIYRRDDSITIISKDGSEKKIHEYEGGVIKELPRYMNIIRFYIHPLALKIRGVVDIIEKNFGKIV
ncbi:MAG: HD domain-containing protein [Sulfolobales archaeon]